MSKKSRKRRASEKALKKSRETGLPILKRKKGKKRMSKEEKEYYERYRKALEKRHEEVKGARLAEKISSHGPRIKLKEEEKKWIEETWGVKAREITSDITQLIPSPGDIHQEIKEGKKNSGKTVKDAGSI